MADLRMLGDDIDTSGGTFHLTDDNNGESTLQKLKIRYQFFLGEWFLDLEEGTPYYEQILVKNTNLPTVQAVLSQVALTCPGVKSIDNFGFDYGAPIRTLKIYAIITDVTGQKITFDEVFKIGVAA